MTDNLKYWNELCRAPKEALKQFQRAGGFKGTAIKPMWSIKRMTEVFGPVGEGWAIDSPKFEVVPAGDEIMVYCTVFVYLKGDNNAGGFYGVGGDKVRVVQSSGPRNDDEAFKKAYTDALTNAFKLLGVGADVHMGLWDGSKYVDDAETMGLTGGTPGASKAPLRADYERMVKEIRNTSSVGALKTWKEANARAIDELPPDWLDELRVEYVDRQNELKEKAAA